MGGNVTPPPASTSTSADLEEHVASALCYLVGPLTGVLFLVLEPYSRNRTVRFHAFQSIFTFVALLIANIAITILGWIPFIGWAFWFVSWSLLPLLCLVLWIGLMVKAYNKERWVLPIVGPLAEKQS
jgi:uncharacterized membrane protein